MNSARPIVVRPAPGAERLSGLDSVDSFTARVFAARGVNKAEDLDYGLARLAPVSELDFVDEAVDLLLANRDRKITVIGDIDADGATSTALMLRCMLAYGFADVDYLVPNRFDFGYGLTPEIVRVAGRTISGTADHGR